MLFVQPMIELPLHFPVDAISRDYDASYDCNAVREPSDMR
jgi:hypothetical protein